MIERAGQKPLTIRGIAELADTSKSTVSRVLRDLPTVAPETRERVEEVIRTHHYQPNMFARGLAKGAYADESATSEADSSLLEKEWPRLLVMGVAHGLKIEKGDCVVLRIADTGIEGPDALVVGGDAGQKGNDMCLAVLCGVTKHTGDHVAVPSGPENESVFALYLPERHADPPFAGTQTPDPSCTGIQTPEPSYAGA